MRGVIELDNITKVYKVGVETIRALDGVSLTVAGLGNDRFDVMIVPFTWAHTSLPSLRVGSRVNLECDMVGKYVARAVELFRPI